MSTRWCAQPIASHDRDQETEMTDETAKPKDSNGTILDEGDSVTLIKDLKVKGTSVTLKRGTLIKNIRLTDDEALIECNAEKVKGLVLRTEFLKKA
ncbi:alkylphosphonate utilization protein [Luteimonas galliterrae]|uniref:alkylphosphonate utilization protein n=1 Tax=Luteimonas galliterrae TaxID=2940486 RepID=UPI003CE5AC6C